MPNETLKIEDLQIALTALLDTLERIDADIASRASFATNIIYSQAYGLDKPVFADEIRVGRKALGLPDCAPEPKPLPVTEEARSTESRFSMEL